jgi:hypothetical protein
VPKSFLDDSKLLSLWETGSPASPVTPHPAAASKMPAEQNLNALSIAQPPIESWFTARLLFPKRSRWLVTLSVFGLYLQ